MRVRVTAAEAGDGFALHTWLRGDAALARQAEVLAGVPEPGSLGAVEIVDLILTQATAISTFALAVAEWRRSRPRPPSTTVTRADGQSLTIDGPPEITAAAIETFLRGGDGTRTD